MEDQARQKEILQAEEAIRLLAGEMARAASAADAAEQISRKLDEAVEVLAGARDRLLAAAEDRAAAGDASPQGVLAALNDAQGRLADAGERLERSLAGGEQARAELSRGIEAARQAADRAAELVETRAADLAAAAAATNRTVQEIHQQVRALSDRLAGPLDRRLRAQVRWLVALVLGLVVAAAAIVLWPLYAPALRALLDG
jgi:hypothetical protein